MRLGIIAEIHANLPALEAALEALRKEGIDQVLAVGGLVGYGPHPRQVIRKLDKEGIPCVPGAADLRAAYALPSPAREGIAETTIVWTREQLGTRELHFLRNLRSRHRYEAPGGAVDGLSRLPGRPGKQGRPQRGAPGRHSENVGYHPGAVPQVEQAGGLGSDPRCSLFDVGTSVERLRKRWSVWAGA